MGELRLPDGEFGVVAHAAALWLAAEHERAATRALGVGHV